MTTATVTSNGQITIAEDTDLVVSPSMPTVTVNPNNPNIASSTGWLERTRE